MATGSTTPKHFNVWKFIKLIEDHGITTQWWKAIPCPCQDKADGWVKPDCSLCGGEGVYFYDQQEITAVFQSLNRERILAEGGFINEVVIDCSFRSTDWIADGDRLAPAYEIVIEKERLEKGATLPSGLTAERTIYRYPQALQKVIDQDGNDYTVGTDVELVADAAGYIRNVSWIGGSPPADGTKYSIRYSALAEYHVHITQPRIRIENDTKQVSWCRLTRITGMRGDS